MDLPVEGLVRPRTFDEAITAFADEPSLLPIAGGTDLSVVLRSGRRGSARLLDLNGILSDAISDDGRAIVIGAGATMDRIARSELVRTHCPELIEAACKVGAWPIQCRATLGGNLGNASPAADTGPPLLVSDARIEAVRARGTRSIPIGDFFRGPGKTALEPGELIRSIHLPKNQEYDLRRFEKLGWRREQIISVVSVALRLRLDPSRRIVAVAAAFGAVAATPIRAATVEQTLLGQPLDGETRTRAVEAVQRDIHPISDVRAPAWYRRMAAATLLQRLLEEVDHA